MPSTGARGAPEATMPEPTTGRCPACHAALPPPARSHRLRRAWFALASLFVLVLLWANRYDYQVCDVDGCVRIDRWTHRVGWVSAEGVPGEEGSQEVFAARARVRSDPPASARVHFRRAACAARCAQSLRPATSTF